MERHDQPHSPDPLQRWLDVAPWPIHHLDSRGRARRPNPPLARLLGYQPDELQELNFEECLSDASRDKLRKTLREGRDSARLSHTDLSLTYRHRRGLEIQARQTRVGPLGDPSRPTLVMLEGIQPAHRLDRSRIQSRMSRLIAHDLNNVFTVAQSYLDLAEREETENQMAHQYLSRALESIRRGIRVTRQLQTIVIDKPFPTEECCIDEVVDALQPFLSRLLPAAPKWSVDCDSRLPPLWSHPALLGRFVIDMAINALLRWPQASIQHLEVRASPGRRRAVLIRIHPADETLEPAPAGFRLFLCESAPFVSEQVDPAFVSDILANHSIPIDVTDRALTALLPGD